MVPGSLATSPDRKPATSLRSLIVVLVLVMDTILCQDSDILALCSALWCGALISNVRSTASCSPPDAQIITKDILASQTRIDTKEQKLSICAASAVVAILALPPET